LCYYWIFITSTIVCVSTLWHVYCICIPISSDNGFTDGSVWMSQSMDSRLDNITSVSDLVVWRLLSIVSYNLLAYLWNYSIYLFLLLITLSYYPSCLTNSLFYLPISSVKLFSINIYLSFRCLFSVFSSWIKLFYVSMRLF
jgi:hypothetical protein